MIITEKNLTKINLYNMIRELGIKISKLESNNSKNENNEIKVNGKMIDIILKDGFHDEICEKLNKEYYVTNYGITCDNEFLMYTGSDYQNNNNILTMLIEKYPNNKFSGTDEFMEIL